MNFETIQERYNKNYIRDDQLERFVKLGVISGKEAETIKMVKNDGGGGTNPLK